jgi:hypothetical protein
MAKYNLSNGHHWASHLCLTDMVESYYSMDITQTLSVTVPKHKHRLLIAIQGHTYKNSEVEELIEAAKGRQINVQVIDVSALYAFNMEDWRTVIVPHTWESWQPKFKAKLFVQRQANHDAKPEQV